MGRLTQKIKPTEKNLEKILNQSGVYILYRRQKSKYVGSAGADRLHRN